MRMGGFADIVTRVHGMVGAFSCGSCPTSGYRYRASGGGGITKRYPISGYPPFFGEVPGILPSTPLRGFPFRVAAELSAVNNEGKILSVGTEGGIFPGQKRYGVSPCHAPSPFGAVLFCPIRESPYRAYPPSEAVSGWGGVILLGAGDCGDLLALVAAHRSD